MKAIGAPNSGEMEKEVTNEAKPQFALPLKPKEIPYK